MMVKLMMRVTVTITVTMTIFQCGFPRRGRGLEELDAGPCCQSSKAKWSFCHSRVIVMIVIVIIGIFVIFVIMIVIVNSVMFLK